MLEEPALDCGVADVADEDKDTALLAGTLLLVSTRDVLAWVEVAPGPLDDAMALLLAGMLLPVPRDDDEVSAMDAVVLLAPLLLEEEVPPTPASFSEPPGGQASRRGHNSNPPKRNVGFMEISGRTRTSVHL